VVEKDGLFLLVEEYSNNKLVLNQPAGHLDEGETLEQAAVRETFEESGWHVELQGILGVSLYHSPHNNTTYHRMAFYAKALSHDPDHPLDKGIEQALWMSYDDILKQSERMRSSMVIRTIDLYRNGARYPLDFIFE